MTASQLTSSTRHCLLASLCLLLFLLFCLKLPNILHPELGGPGGLGPPTSLFGTVFSAESKSFFKTIRIPLLPTNGSSSFGLGLNRTRAAERLSTLEACVDGSARRVGSWEDLPEFDEWTGDVLLQTDNRPVNFTSASAWTQRGRNEGGFVYNSLMAKQFGMLYVFIHGAEECVSPFGERLIGYWCKVPALRVAMYMFPRARSIIYIDSDAYIRASASPDAFYKVHELDLGENSPMYVQRDNSYWKVLVEEAYSVRYALNSGVIVFSPKSKLVKDALNLWWQALTRPRFQSNLDAYKSQIHMSLFFGESCTFNEQSVVLEDHAVLERFRKAFETLVSQRTKDVPLAHFFAPAAARVQDPQPRIDWIKLNYKDRNKRFVLKARFGHFANSTEISNIEKDLRQRPGKVQLEMDSIVGCKSTKMRYATDRSNDFKRSWPGDQDRLQHMREVHPKLVRVLPYLAQLSKLPRGSLFIDRLVWHPCLSMMLKDEAKQYILTYMSMKQRMTEEKMKQALREIPALCMNNTENF